MRASSLSIWLSADLDSSSATKVSTRCQQTQHVEAVKARPIGNLVRRRKSDSVKMGASIKRQELSSAGLPIVLPTTDAMTSPIPMPSLDQVLLDPSSSSSIHVKAPDPDSQSSRRIFGPHTASTAATAASCGLFMQNGQQTNRPVKRSSVGVPVSSPKRQAEARAASRADETTLPRLSIMRSPPPLSKNPFKPSKRALEAPFATGGDRPSKRVNNIATQVNVAGVSGCAASTGATELERIIPTKARRSGSFPSDSAPASTFVAHLVDSDCKDPELFVPPTLPNSISHHPHSSAHAHSFTRSPQDSGSFLRSSLSPSKFGLSAQDGAASHEPSRPSDDTVYGSSKAVLSVNTSQPACLAPSPLRPDEHVPRPLSDPVPVLPSQMTRSGSSNSLNASPSRVQPAFGNPFLKTREGRAHISGVMTIPNCSPPASVGRSGAPVTAVIPSKSIPRPLSPITRNDLMHETIEKSLEYPAKPALAKASLDYHKVGHDHGPNPTDLTYSGQNFNDSHGSAKPSNPPQTITLSQHNPKLASAGSNTLHAVPVTADTRKRPHPSTSDSSLMESEPKLPSAYSTAPVRSRREHRLSSRQASRKSVVDSKDALPLTESASDIGDYTNANKRRSLDLKSHDPPRYCAAAAGGTAPITRPPSHRSLSAPSIHGQQEPTNDSDVDVFKAPTASYIASRKCISADTTIDAEDSSGTLDADTSVMSSSGLSSLANLQNLLSRMSRPSISRRTSSAFPNLDSLPETVDIESASYANVASNAQTSHVATNTSTSRGHSGAAALPRYASATSSSAARQSKSSKGPGDPDLPAVSASSLRTKEARKRNSSGAPEIRRGSLLPVAVNAAQRLMVRPDATDVEGSRKEPASAPTKLERATILKDVVAFVDVKTAEGDEAGGVFVDILRSLGARVGFGLDNFSCVR